VGERPGKAKKEASYMSQSKELEEFKISLISGYPTVSG
jgi:hypothetical protein